MIFQGIGKTSQTYRLALDDRKSPTILYDFLAAKKVFIFNKGKVSKE